MKIRFPFLAMMIMMLAAAAPAPAAPDAAALGVMPSFAPIVEKAESAVVNISAVRVVKGGGAMRMERGNNPFGFDDDFFDRFFRNPVPRGDRKEHSLGTGFIFDEDGYVVTNNHVIEGAEDITVKLSSGTEVKAEIIGRDPKTDLALIKLKKEGKYPFLALGDSNQVKVGDWVMAIGNPLGFDHTVTAGILSARGRSFGVGPYDDFLQTDASINPGNSGGPLLNMSGEVIGINTMIATGGGRTNIGIGFAIPTNLAKGVITQLKEKGRVVRGWMGVMIQPVSPDMAKSMGLDEPRGALVADIDPEGPGVAAKLKRGDIVLTFDGQAVKDWQDLPLMVANTQVGKKVKVVVFRDKKEVTLDLTVAELKDDSPEGPGQTGASEANKLGLVVKELTPELAARQRLSEEEGLIVTGIEPDSEASESGLAAGDLILEVDSKEVKTLADYRKAVNAKKKDDIIRFLVKRGSSTMFFTVTVR
ncbi:Do family serine endopeptidase [Deltaproteobacteria bacterium OttesenSCG-928-M10]|nr:Do family serine endopeptidase [Deltaproteobacteria bacterium OttesenSCG-928-M10]